MEIDKINVKIIREEGVKPLFYATEGSAGFDITAKESGFLDPGRYTLVKTGIKMEIPVGYELQIRPRSGLALKNGITCLNSPGTIDSDYRGEIGVILVNHNSERFTWNAGDRIAQGVFAKYSKATLVDVDELSDTERGSGGFGSTNV